MQASKQAGRVNAVSRLASKKRIATRLDARFAGRETVSETEHDPAEIVG
jgi:hypothetical protein